MGLEDGGFALRCGSFLGDQGLGLEDGGFALRCGSFLGDQGLGLDALGCVADDALGCVAGFHGVGFARSHSATYLVRCLRSIQRVCRMCGVCRIRRREVVDDETHGRSVVQLALHLAAGCLPVEGPCLGPCVLGALRLGREGAV